MSSKASSSSYSICPESSCSFAISCSIDWMVNWLVYLDRRVGKLVDESLGGVLMAEIEVDFEEVAEYFVLGVHVAEAEV
jgi:hypothetical protein